MNDQKFNEERLEHLIKMWHPGADAYLTNFGTRREIVFEIHKEATKPGCKEGFSAAVHRIGLGESTAWDMRMRHRVQIGEMPDPDAPDPRDEEEGRPQGEEESKGDTDEPTKPVPGEAAKSETPPSEPAPAPTKCQRRLLADFDDDDLPEPSGEGKSVNPILGGGGR
jgi:hypothetical protein